MAAPSVSFDGTRVNDAEFEDPAGSNEGTWDKWDASQSPAEEPDVFYQEGTGTTGHAISNKVGTSQAGVELFSLTSTIDFETTEKVWLAKVIATNYGVLNNQGSTGLILYIGSATTTNRYLLYASGGDVYPPTGGWLFIPWNPNIAAFQDATEGTPDLTAVDYFALTANFSATSKVENVACDAVDYFDVGTGLTLIGGDGASADAVFADFVAADQDTVANRWGIVRTASGVLYTAAFLTVGSATETDFTDATGGTMVFPDGPFGPGTVGISVNLSNASSVFACTGWTFTSSGSTTDADSRPDFDFTGTTSTVGGSYTGCAFRVFRNWTMTSKGTLTDCIFADGALVTMVGGTITNGVFSGGAGTHYVLTANPTLLDACDFTQGASGHAVRCDTIGTYDWTNTDTGYTGTRGSNLVSSTGSTDAMFYNNSGGLITLNVSGGGQSPSVRNGASATTSVVNSVTLTINVQDEAKNPIQNAQTSIHLAESPFTELMNEDTTAGGVAAEAYVFVSDVDVVLRVRKSDDLDSPRYQAFGDTVTITGDFTRTVTLKVQPLPI